MAWATWRWLDSNGLHFALARIGLDRAVNGFTAAGRTGRLHCASDGTRAPPHPLHSTSQPTISPFLGVP